MAERIFVGMGSNSTDRESQLLAARSNLTRLEGISVVACSWLYDTAAIGPAQPRFLNAVVSLDCALEPTALLSALQKVEQVQGRVRAERWGPRTIDLDILLWEGRVISDPALVVPHPQLHRRRFALEPLVELHPDAQHPVLNEPVVELLRRVMDQDVVKWRSDRWLAGGLGRQT